MLIYSSLLVTGEHSDLVLRCNDGKEFKVHKAVVCAQSDFFRKACKPDKFKVGKFDPLNVNTEGPDVGEPCVNIATYQESAI